MGSRFSALRGQPTLLPTSQPSSPSSQHSSISSSIFSPSLHSLLGPTIPLSSPFWSSSLLDLCLSLSHLSSIPSSSVHSVLLRSCHVMSHSTLHHSYNLHHLMLVLSYHILDLVADPSAYHGEGVTQLTQDGVINLLFLCRTFLHYLIQHTPLHQLCEIFAYESPPFSPSPPPSPLPSTKASADFLRALFTLITSLPVSPSTYDLHLEALTTLQTLFSSQLYHPTSTLSPSSHPFFSCAFSLPLSSLAPSLIDSLLSHTSSEITAHFELPHPPPPRPSLLSRLSLSLSSLLLLPLSLFRYFFPPPSLPYPLADRSLILLLLLLHQARPNPFRDSLPLLVDDAEGEGEGGLLRVSYDEIYQSLLYTLPSPPAVLLLFSLLHLSPSFLSYVYAKTEIELLILPLLQSLYLHIKSLDKPQPSSSTSPKHVYMILITLLILSSDSSFVSHSHRHLLSRIPWHSDYALSSISLASFSTLLLLRLLHHHLTTSSPDAYIISNTLAILSNVAQSSSALHPAVIRRMVVVLEVCSKRYKRLKRMERMRKVTGGGEDGDGENEKGDDLLSTISQYLSVLCVCAHPHHLHENVQLVYWLMNEKRHILLLSDEPRHAISRRVAFLLGLIAHFELVVDVYYRQEKASAHPLHLISPPPSTPLKVQSSHNGDLDPVLSAIALDATHWRHTIKESTMGDLVEEPQHFHYVEQHNSEEFMIPMIWEVQHDTGEWREWGEDQEGQDMGEEEMEEERVTLLTVGEKMTNGHAAAAAAEPAV